MSVTLSGNKPHPDTQATHASHMLLRIFNNKGTQAQLMDQLYFKKQLTQETASEVGWPKSLASRDLAGPSHLSNTAFHH